jgi:hypothetical protein
LCTWIGEFERLREERGPEVATDEGLWIDDVEYYGLELDESAFDRGIRFYSAAPLEDENMARERPISFLGSPYGQAM